MSGKCYQTYGMQRRETRSTRRGKACAGASREKFVSEPVLVTVSPETAEKLRRASERHRIPQESLAVEAIQRGVGLLVGNSLDFR